MRGVKQELFAGLVRNLPRSVAEFRTEATTIEKALQQRSHHYNRDVSSAPMIVITDRGAAFTAKLMQYLMKMTHTSHRKSTAYHPQTNVLTERLNRTLADMLSMYVDLVRKTWDAILPYANFAYNTAVEETTQVIPFQLVYGRIVTTILDAMLPVDADNNNNPYDVDDSLQRAEEARQLAWFRIRQQQRRDASYYNLRRSEVQYQSGDKVWVWTPVRRRGLSENCFFDTLVLTKLFAE